MGTTAYTHQAPKFSVGQRVVVKEARTWHPDRPGTIVNAWERTRAYTYEVEFDDGIRGLYCTAHLRKAA